MSQTDLLAPNVSGEVGDNPKSDQLPGIAGSLASDTSNSFSRIQWINGELTAAEKHVKPWRIEAQQAASFVSGDQLDQDTRAELKSARRPDTSINITQKYLHYVSGLQRRSHQGLVYRPTVVDNRLQQLVGEYATQTYEWAYRLCNGRDSVARVFEDMLTTGMGWSDKYIDRLRDPRGLIQYPRVPWEEMLWPECCDDNISTTRWRARESWIEKQEAIRRWPTCAGIITAAAGSSDEDRQFPSQDVTIFTIPLIQSVPIDKGAPSEESHRGRVKVTQFQWYDDQSGFTFTDPITGEPIWLSIRDFHRYNRRLRETMPGMAELDAEQVHHRVVKVVYLLNRRHELSPPARLPGDRFTLCPLTGHWDSGKRRWYGFVRLLMDPQRSANAFARLAHEIMAISAKGGAIVQSDAFKNLEQQRNFAKTYTTPGAINIVAPEALEKMKIKEKTTGEFPQAAMQLLQFCVGPLTDVVTGLPGTSLGIDTQEVPGVVMQQGQQVGKTILAKEFDSLSLYRREEGLAFLSFLRLIADDTRLVRIGGDMSGQVMPLLRRPFVEEYDVWVDESEQDPNMRSSFQKFLLQALPSLVKAGKFTNEMFDYLPIPYKIRQSIIKSMQQEQEQRQAAAQAGINMGGRGPVRDPQETAAKVADVRARAAVHAARALDIPHKSKRDDFKAVMEAMGQHHGQQADRAAHALEINRASLDHSRQKLDEDKALADFAVRLLSGSNANQQQQGQQGQQGQSQQQEEMPDEGTDQ